MTRGSFLIGRTTVEVFAAKRGFYFRAKARNGEIIAVSESYTRRHDAHRGARRAFPSSRIIDV